MTTNERAALLYRRLREVERRLNNIQPVAEHSSAGKHFFFQIERRCHLHTATARVIMFLRSALRFPPDRTLAMGKKVDPNNYAAVAVERDDEDDGEEKEDDEDEEAEADAEAGGDEEDSDGKHVVAAADDAAGTDDGPPVEADVESHGGGGDGLAVLEERESEEESDAESIYPSLMHPNTFSAASGNGGRRRRNFGFEASK